MNDQPIPATDPSVAAALPALPRETSTLATATVQASVDPAAPLWGGSVGGKEIDATGNFHDPKLHESPPRKNRHGYWAAKRGNGARAAKGLAPTGATIQGRKAAPRPPAAPPAAGGLVSDMGAAPAAAPPPDGGADQVHEGVPAPLLTEAEYEATAQTLSRGVFVGCTLLFGKAWEPDRAENAAISNAVRRVWAEHQLPRVGALWELAVSLFGYVARRRDDPATRETVGGWFRRWRGEAPRESSISRSAPAAPAPEAPAEAAVVEPPPRRDHRHPGELIRRQDNGPAARVL